jgi:hypothetical protein
MELARREEHCQATRALNKIAAKAAPDQKEKERVEAVAAAETKKTAHFAGILDGMEEQQYSLADFLEYVFNQSTKFATGYDWRWCGFFAHKQTVKKIFSYWSSSVTRSAHTFVLDWAYGLVKKMMSSECIARSGLLSKTKKTVNEDFFLKYSLTGLSQTLCEMTPPHIRHFRCILHHHTPIEGSIEGAIETIPKETGCGELGLFLSQLCS